MSPLSMMFVGSFLIQFIFMSLVMTDSVGHITFSLGKFYLSVIMGLCMVIYELLMRDVRLQSFFPFLLLLILFIYFYRTQFGIGDHNYLKEMIEHHSMALVTSKNIRNKTKRGDTIDLASRIQYTQEREIKEMEHMLTMK